MGARRDKAKLIASLVFMAAWLGVCLTAISNRQKPTESSKPLEPFVPESSPVLTAEEREQAIAEYSRFCLDRVNLSKTISLVERLDKLPTRELLAGIEEAYKARKMMGYLFVKAGQPTDTMNSLCDLARNLKKFRVLGAMIEKANDHEDRESFMVDHCASMLGFPDELRKQWSASIDFRKKPHLMRMSKYLDQPRTFAKSIIDDHSLSTSARCEAAQILSATGKRRDLAFLEARKGILMMPTQHCVEFEDGFFIFGEHNAAPGSPGPCEPFWDCALRARDLLKYRLRQDEAKKRSLRAHRSAVR